MELYTKTSYEVSELLTRRYSTSFSMASRLFERSIQRHIYAIYGMVRIADEIVDSYRGADAAKRLDEFKAQVFDSLRSGYSTNPIVHAYVDTATTYGIGTELIEPFFESMHTDLLAKKFTKESYQRYIYGSAEVVGLMCLKVFTLGDHEQYEELKKGAQALGAAYQKVNFLRDMRADYDELGRVYFPRVNYETFSEADKKTIVDDIKKDFAIAKKVIPHIPTGAKKAVSTSYQYYYTLLQKLDSTPAATLKRRRIRISDIQKTSLYIKARFGQ